MSVTFPVTVESDVAHAQSSIPFAMSGVTSGQPIVVTILGNDPTIHTYSLSDTFATPYTWTLVENGDSAPNALGCSTWIGTGGAGTSGTITVSGGAMITSYVGGIATSCLGASTASGLGAVDSSTTATGTNTSAASIQLTPSESDQGFLSFISVVQRVNVSPSSPFVNTAINYLTTQVGGESVYSAPPTGSPLVCAWTIAATDNYQATALVVKAPGAPAPKSGMLLVA